MCDRTKNVWPLKLRIRDTQLHDDIGGAGQRIYTTAGQGYEKREYVRADEIERLQARVDDLEADREKRVDKWMQLMVEKDERIERLEDVRDAADRIYNRDMHSQSDEDHLREALAATEQSDKPVCSCPVIRGRDERCPIHRWTFTYGSDREAYRQYKNDLAHYETAKGESGGGS
jgi:hypothetical protein